MIANQANGECLTVFDSASFDQITANTLTIQGSYVGSLNEIAELLDLVNRKGAPDVPVATRPLDQVNAALNDLRAGKVIGRVVVTP